MYQYKQFSIWKILFLTLFAPMYPFDPPENLLIRKPLANLCFQGEQKETLGRKELCGFFRRAAPKRKKFY